MFEKRTRGEHVNIENRGRDAVLPLHNAGGSHRNRKGAPKRHEHRGNETTTSRMRTTHSFDPREEKTSEACIARVGAHYSARAMDPAPGIPAANEEIS